MIRQLAEDTLIVYLKPSNSMLEQIIERSLREPKPMYYQDSFLDEVLPDYLRENNSSSPDLIVPAEFFRWMFPRLVQHRLPLYQAISNEFGVEIQADHVDDIQSEEDFIDLVCEALA